MLTRRAAWGEKLDYPLRRQTFEDTFYETAETVCRVDPRPFLIARRTAVKAMAILARDEKRLHHFRSLHPGQRDCLIAHILTGLTVLVHLRKPEVVALI